MATAPYVKVQLEENPRPEGAVSVPSTGPNRLSTNIFFFPATSASLAGNPAQLDRSDEMRGTYSPPPDLIDGYDPVGSIAERAYPNSLPVFLLAAGMKATITPGDGTNEQQQVAITGAPTGGSFTLTFGAQTTAAIPYNATAAQVQAALEKTSTIGKGNVVCTGGPLPTAPVVVEFVKALGATDVALMTSTDSLTGGATPASAVTVTTPGVDGTVTDPGGYKLPTGAYRWQFSKVVTAIPQTLQIIVGYPMHDFFLLGTGMAASRLTLGADGAFTADLMGLYVDSIADPGDTVSVDSDAILPIRRGDIVVSFANGASAKVTDFSLTQDNPLERGPDLGIQTYFPGSIELTGIPTLSGSISKRVVDALDFAAEMKALPFAASATWRAADAIGSTNYPPSVFVEMPKCQYRSGGPEAASNTRRYGASYDWRASYSEAAGYDYRWTVVNSVPAVATYV